MFKYLSNFYTQYINDSIIGKEKLALALKILIIKRKDHIHNVLYYIVYISYSRGLLGVPDLQGGDVLCPAPAPLPPAELVAQELPVDLALVGGAPRDLDGARAAETGEIIHCLVSVVCAGIRQAGVDNIILSLYIYF